MLGLSRWITTCSPSLMMTTLMAYRRGGYQVILLVIPMGRQVQNSVHKVIGSDHVNGWDNQIENEVIINLNYEYRRRLAAFRFNNGLKADLIGQAGAMAGTLNSMATIRVGGRIGWPYLCGYG